VCAWGEFPFIMMSVRSATRMPGFNTPLSRDKTRERSLSSVAHAPDLGCPRLSHCLVAAQ